VLDPRSTRSQASTADIRQTLVTSGSAGTPNVALAPFAEVEITLANLPNDVEQEADGALEPLISDGTVDVSGNAAPWAPLGLRLAYRVSYDPASDSVEHRVYYPILSDPTTDKYIRVPTVVRTLLPVVFLNSARPLQLRAEGLLRRLVSDNDPVTSAAALHTLEGEVAAAASGLSANTAIEGVLDALVADTGPARRIGDGPVTAKDIQFLPEDGSLAGLLRALQPVLRLDDAGALPLESHGSTTTAVLSAAEALLLAASTMGAMIVGDDLGEGLDGPTTEHLANALRGGAAQVWLTTRRADAARAFETTELVRLTRHTGTRKVHQVALPADRKEAGLHRHIQAQLLPALTATTVAVSEGRHDLSALSAADRRRTPPDLPLAAHGIRLITADTGSGGGTGQIPQVAKLAHQLGYRVVALVDGDPIKKAGTVLADIENECDALVRLPETMAIERAILAGATVTQVRAAATAFTDYGQSDPTLGQPDEDVPNAVMMLLHSKGLHEQFLGALIEETGALPPVVVNALTAIALCGHPAYKLQKRIDLTDPTATV
jgi:putative ATP-dependent endonuclease of OLD family